MERDGIIRIHPIFAFRLQLAFVSEIETNLVSMLSCRADEERASGERDGRLE